MPEEISLKIPAGLPILPARTGGYCREREIFFKL